MSKTEVYPNPINQNDILHLKHGDNIESYNLYNSQGRLVLRDVFDTNNKRKNIPIKDLETGMYYLTLFDVKVNKTDSIKILIE